jgi:uncharacterized protein (TIGR03643 family)
MENNMENYCFYSDLPSPMAYMQKAKDSSIALSLIDIDRVIEMAWEDRTSFDAIKLQFGLNESQVKALMKKNLKFGSYKLWRKRVENCKTKHDLKRVAGMKRFKSKAQKLITNNTISKRK